MSTPGSSAWRAENWGPGCNKSNEIVPVYWMIGLPKVQCHKNAVRAFRALGRVMHEFGYVVRGDATGGYNCRKLTGSTTIISAHAQGIALDVNWDTNPYRLDRLVTDMPQSMIAAIHSVKNDGGVPAFRWGGNWDWDPGTSHSNYDAMHFELICTPHDVKIGFSIPAFAEGDRRMWPLLALHEKGGAVTQLQMRLAAVKIDVEPDGYFGPLTEEAVKQFQVSRGLPNDGVVGYGTWTSLFTRQPILAEGDPSPHKGQAIAA